MRCITTVVGFVALMGASPVLAQGNAAPSEPFKLGTFQIDAGPQVGIVLQDRYVIELDRANEALQVNPDYARVSIPATCWGSLGSMSTGLKYRTYEICHRCREPRSAGRAAAAAYIHDVDDLRILAPILYPGKILNAAELLQPRVRRLHRRGTGGE